MTSLVCPHCDSAFDSDKRLARADVTECKLCQQKFVVTQSTLKSYKKAMPEKTTSPSMPHSIEKPSKINCPHCSAGLEGQMSTGQIVECSQCHKQFEATPERLNNTTPVLAKADISPNEVVSRKSKSKLGMLALIFLALVVIFPFIVPDSNPVGADTDTTAAKTTIDPNAPENFFSGWNGSNKELVDLVKSTMNDPDSFEHVETRFSDKGNSLSILMTYRGKNGFNATITNSVSADLNKATRQLSNLQQR
jgi:DNA-directed RNA polymerase subunit RPC12/RpoP